MDALMDPNDQALMDGLQALGPLLLGARKHLDGNDDHQPKRHKAASPADASADPAQTEAMATMLRLMAQLILSHERSIQLQLRQDCFVLFAQDRPEGIIPHLKALAQSWRDQAPKHQDDQKWPTLRTHLVAGVVAELHRRVQQLAASKKGEPLWDLAVEKGTLLPDGSWGFQRWCHDTKQLKRASRPALPMPQMLREPSVVGGPASVEQPCPEVPQPEDDTDHGSMAPPTVAPQLRRLVSPTGPLPEHSVVPIRDVGQTAQHGPVETGSDASGHLEPSPHQATKGRGKGKGSQKAPQRS